MKQQKSNLDLFPDFLVKSLPEYSNNIEFTEGFIGRNIVKAFEQSMTDKSLEQFSMPISARYINMGVLLNTLFIGDKESLDSLIHSLSEPQSEKLPFYDAIQFIKDLAVQKSFLNSESSELFFKYFMPTMGFDDHYRETIDTKENLIKLSHLAQGARIYSIRDNIISMLQKTNFDDSLIADLLRAPEEGVVYVELGKNRLNNELPVLISKRADGTPEEEPLEGFYVYEFEMMPEDYGTMHSSSGKTNDVSLNDMGYSGFSSIRIISFHFEAAGVKADGSINEDSGYHFFSLYIPVYEDGREISLEELLNRSIDYFLNDKVFSDSLIAMIKFSVMSLLFINFSEYREAVKEGQKGFEKFISAGTKKKSKVFRQSKRKVDRIYIGDKNDALEKPKKEGVSKPVRTHYRRGHFRAQRYGEGRSKIKTLWIKPMLIGSSSKEPKIKERVFT